MSSSLLSKEERERILRTIEEDREFRYALAGAIGILEILKRLDSIEGRIEELSKAIEEHSKILKEHSKKLEEHSKRIEEHSKRIEELAEAIKEHSRLIRRLEVSVGSLGRRIGLDLERTIFNVYRDMLFGLGIRDVGKIEKFTFTDHEGRYLSRGAKIEVDIYTHDNELYLVEVKSLLEEEDIEWFNRKCEIIAEILGRNVKRKIIVAVNTTREALERAGKLGIDIVYGTIVD